MIEANPGLYDEIVEIYRANQHLSSADVLLHTLNGPARIQQRGFQVTAEHLLAVIVANWRINDKSRFVLYDIDASELADTRVFRDQMTAAEEVEQLPGDNIVLRLQVP